MLFSGFHSSSAGKESTCNAGDSTSILQSGRSPQEGIGYSLRYSWASLVAQMVKNPLAIQSFAISELNLGSIPGLGISLEEIMATHFSILAWGIPIDRGGWQLTSMRLQSQT